MALDTHLYDLLRVPPSATQEEIARSYKRIALRCHPDKTNHDPQLTEKFKEVTQAYEILRDHKRRQIYDRYGQRGLDGDIEPPSAQEVHIHTANVFSQVFSDISSIFETTQTFGGGFFAMPQQKVQGMKQHISPAPAADHRVVKGEDIHHTFKVTLADMYFGKQVKFQLPKKLRCLLCKGQGTSNPLLCRTCKGSGRVVVTMFNDFSKFQELSSCKTCSGTGIYIRPSDKCGRCERGYYRENKIITVMILPGSKNGDRVILQGEADEGRNVVPGDVIIHLQEVSHPYLVRKFNDLYAEYDIDLKTALLGGTIVMKDFLQPGRALKINIRTHESSSAADSDAEIVGTINPGTPKIVKGLGMPINDSILDGVFYQDPSETLELADVLFDIKRLKRGNLFIKFNVQLPDVSTMTSESLAALHQALPAPKLNQDHSMEANLLNLPDYSSPPRDNDRKRFKHGSSSSNDSYDYNDIDINDEVDGDDNHEQAYYNRKWRNTKT